jgi:malate dehydrogenase (oxaloacetate-decarboxylating)(NADP+)
MNNQNYFGVMMVETGQADGFIGGYSSKYADTIRPALQIVGTKEPYENIAGMYIVMTKKGPFFFADTTVNYSPTARTMVETALMTADVVRNFRMTPVIAMVSYSNFGSTKEGSPKKVREAVKYLHDNYPDLLIDGEMQANYAFNTALREDKYPFSKINGHDVNTVIFPNLSSGNIAYKMMNELGGAEIIGPIVMGIRKPINVLQMNCTIREIVDIAAVTVIGAQDISK